MGSVLRSTGTLKMIEYILNSWWFKLASYAFLAFIGGALGYIMRAVDKQEKVLVWRVFLEGIGAAFVGVLVMFICQEAKFSAGYTGVIVGVCGWLGANVTIRLLEGFVRRKLGLKEGVSDVVVDPQTPATGQ